MEDRARSFEAGVFASLHLHSRPQHVEPLSRGSQCLGRHPRGSQRAFYARSCIRTSQNATSTHFGE